MARKRSEHFETEPNRGSRLSRTKNAELNEPSPQDAPARTPTRGFGANSFGASQIGYARSSGKRRKVMVDKQEHGNMRVCVTFSRAGMGEKEIWLEVTRVSWNCSDDGSASCIGHYGRSILLKKRAPSSYPGAIARRKS